ncbi:MAG: class I SAM-dependent methyltransferase [Actinomycetota bacterium]
MTNEPGTIEALKAQARLEWNAGDYSYTGPRVEPASIELVAAIGIDATHRVLDVAAGDGNLSLAAAGRGAQVVALDFSERMIANGRPRTADATVTWLQGDAERLPFADGTFDIVASVFGVMFAPDQARAAAELARVVRPGGRVAVTGWTPEGNVGTFIRSQRGPLKEFPEDAPEPLRWGTREGVEELLGPHCDEVTSTSKWLTFRYVSWDEYMIALGSNGSAITAKKKLPAEAYRRGLAAIRTLVESFNQATDGSVVYEGEYLETIGIVR